MRSQRNSFGSNPAFNGPLTNAVELALQQLITAVTPLFPPSVVAPGQDLFPEPIVNVNDRVPETASFSVPADGPYLVSLGLLDIGGFFGPRSELFSQVLLLNIDRDADDDDTFQLLSEMITGVSGGTFENESVPGIEGVTLASLTPGAYTLVFDNGRAKDALTLEGPGAAAAIAALASEVNLSDGASGLELVDLSVQSIALGAANPIADLAQGALDSAAELTALLRAALDPEDARISLLGLEGEAVALRIANAAAGTADVVIFTGEAAETAIEAVAQDRIDPRNAESELVIVDGIGREVIGVNVRGFGRDLTEDELPDLLAAAARRSDLSAIDQGDSIRFEIRGAGGSLDVIIWETDTPAPPGAAEHALLA